MKSRAIILITLSLLYVFGAKAQEKKVALGLAFNPSINWLKANSSGLETHGNKIGFNYGLLADFNFGENYSYATGLFINNGVEAIPGYLYK